MNIKKSQLLEIIKSVVHEAVAERKEKMAKKIKGGRLAEQQMKEEAPPGFSADGKHAKIYNKIMQQYKGHPEKAYPTMWSVYNKVSEALNMMNDTALTSEAAYQVVAPKSYEVQKDDHARAIQTDPKVNEASYKVVSKKVAQVQKDNQALKVQHDPKVNETAYKTQGPSLKVQKDSPQFPKAVNDPKNA